MFPSAVEFGGLVPLVFRPTPATVNVLNNDGTQRMQPVIVNGSRSFVPVTQTIPSYQLTFPGGDTNVITNFEYRIPIFGPVVLALLDRKSTRLNSSHQIISYAVFCL